ncbi:hypothetical protein CYMTET_32980, partial [Cymbomonas tetramitiformis]
PKLDYFRVFSAGQAGWVQTLQTGCAGAFSRSLAAAIFCPITVVKTRMEYSGVNGIYYKNTMDALLQIGRKEKLRGLYSGLGFTVMRDAPYSGLYLAMYTGLQAKLLEKSLPYENVPPSAVNFVSAALAGAVATIATHPPDVLRTRLQIQNNMTLRGSSLATNIGDILRKEGPKAFMAGIVPRVLRRSVQVCRFIFPGAQVCWFIFPGAQVC